MNETVRLPEDPDYSREFTYRTDGALSLKALWVDRPSTGKPGVWLESNDGNRVRIPMELRGLVAKRVREAQFR